MHILDYIDLRTIVFLVYSEYSNWLAIIAYPSSNAMSGDFSWHPNFALALHSRMNLVTYPPYDNFSQPQLVTVEEFFTRADLEALCLPRMKEGLRIFERLEIQQEYFYAIPSSAKPAPPLKSFHTRYLGSLPPGELLDWHS